MAHFDVQASFFAHTRGFLPERSLLSCLVAARRFLALWQAAWRAPLPPAGSWWRVHGAMVARKRAKNTWQNVVRNDCRNLEAPIRSHQQS